MKSEFPIVYGCKAKDDELRLKSSSGGVFSLIASEVLKDRGVVYGVTMSKDCYHAEFIRIDNKDDLCRLRGSKYIQAILGDTYKNVKFDLESKRKVLFSGTPCQINGLKNFIGEENGENLICLDLICHGVPSPKLWEIYIKNFEQKHKSKVINVNFRSKIESWGNFGIDKNYNNNKTEYIGKEDDTFMQFFLRNLCLRDCCYNCLAKKNHMSDIQIGDFWGANIVAPEIYDELGSSLVISYTEKGNKVIEKILPCLDFCTIAYDEAVKCNSAIISSPVKPSKRNEILSDMSKMNYKKLCDKYLNFSLRKKIKLIIKKTFLWKLLKIVTKGGCEASNYFMEITMDRKADI